MINTWFISDLHLGHKNILKYENEARPFNTVEKMNETIIQRWNEVVAEKDIVYVLGDFAFGKHNIQLASRLRGKKRLVMGNHDTYPTSLYLQYFDKCYGVVFYERCILSHVPVHTNSLGSRWLLNVHGHLHSRVVLSGNYKIIKEGNQEENCVLEKQPDKNYINVSCEQNNLTPIHKDIIMERLKEIS